jgi:hypothetical protein
MKENDFSIVCGASYIADGVGLSYSNVEASLIEVELRARVSCSNTLITIIWED